MELDLKCTRGQGYYSLGWILRMATPDGYSGWLLRTTAAGYAATEVLSALPRASLALGKPPTRRPVSPVPVPSPSMIARLGRDSRIYTLRPHNPN